METIFGNSMRSRGLSLVILIFFASLLTERSSPVSTSMVADSGNSTLPYLNDTRIFWSSKDIGGIRVYNGLFAFKYADVLSRFTAQTKDKFVILSDYPDTGWYSSMIFCNDSNTKLLRSFSNITNAFERNKNYMEIKTTYRDSSYPIDVDVYARLYARLPILNVTVLMAAPSHTTVSFGLYVKSSPTSSGGVGNWASIYVPGLGWSNYSNPDSSTYVDFVHSSNKSDWNDNYIIPWVNSTDRTAQIGLGFTNRTQLSYLRAYHDTSAGNITQIHMRTLNEYSTNSFTIYYFNVPNANPQNLTELVESIQTYAHMAITERDITYEQVDQTENTETWKVYASFTDRPLGGWSLSPVRKLPTFFNTTGDIYGSLGYTSLVDTASSFVIPRAKAVDYDTYTSMNYARNVLNYVLADSFWVNTSCAAGWRARKDSVTISTTYSTYIVWSLHEYHQITGSQVFYEYLKDYLDTLVKYQASNGSIPLYINSTDGSTYGDYLWAGSNFYALTSGSILFNNSGYLQAAQKNANYYHANDLKNLYHADLLTLGLLRLYEITKNITYYTWLTELVDFCFDNLKGNLTLFGWDVSTNSHACRALAHILLELGDITCHNLTQAVHDALEWNIRSRTILSGQALRPSSKYPLYTCHQMFAINAELLYLKHLMKNGLFNRTYFRVALENWAWIEGNNEKQFDFFNNTEGSMKRRIYLSDDAPKVSAGEVAYDQSEALMALLRFSQIQNWITQYDSGGITFEYAPYFDVIINGTLTEIRWSTSPYPELRANLSAPSGVKSISRISCGERGEPKNVNVSGAESFSESYDLATKTLTINITHSGLAEIVIDWKLQGDINDDGIVSIYDLALVCKAYGSKEGDENYNPDADLNDDGIIDITDLAIVDENYGKSV